MNDNAKESALIERFLQLLQVTDRGITYDALADLVQQYFIRVPFENLSKLYYYNRDGRRTIPDFEMYLDGIELYGFGGTCFANNSYLHRILRYLGYDVSRCGADMTDADVHLVNIVRIEGREYLVDAGYAAPFLKPLPRDLDQTYSIISGNTEYKIHPQDATGNTRVDLYRDGKPAHGYVAKPIHRSFAYFSNVIEHSFRPEAEFLNSILMVRFYPDRTISIRNLSVITSTESDCEIQRLSGKDDLIGAIEHYFSVPPDIIKAALAKITNFE